MGRFGRFIEDVPAVNPKKDISAMTMFEETFVCAQH
jgi:hypothetical protein